MSPPIILHTRTLFRPIPFLEPVTMSASWWGAPLPGSCQGETLPSADCSPGQREAMEEENLFHPALQQTKPGPPVTTQTGAVANCKATGTLLCISEEQSFLQKPLCHSSLIYPQHTRRSIPLAEDKLHMNLMDNIISRPAYSFNPFIV